MDIAVYALIIIVVPAIVIGVVGFLVLFPIVLVGALSALGVPVPISIVIGLVVGLWTDARLARWAIKEFQSHHQGYPRPGVRL